MSVTLLYRRRDGWAASLVFGSRDEALDFAAVQDDYETISAERIVDEGGAVVWDGFTSEGREELMARLPVEPIGPSE